MIENGIGASVRRKEDIRFLTGKGNYTDDVNVVEPALSMWMVFLLNHAQCWLFKQRDVR